MTLAIAVVAFDDRDSAGLTLLLCALLRDVAEFVAVAALGQTTVDNLAGILEALKILLRSLGPDLTLTGTRSGGAEAVSDRVLLVHVTLQIHVGHGGSHVWLLDRNEEKTDILVAESLLQLDISGVGSSLDIGLDRRLGVVELTFLDSSLDLLPGVVRGHVGKLATVNLAGRGAAIGAVA